MIFFRTPSRWFLALLVATAACSGGASEAPVETAVAVADSDANAASSGTGTVVRLVAANLSSGQHQSYDPGHGIRILQALKPDVVMIQEFNYGRDDADDLNRFVSTTFGPSFTYVREDRSQIPNGVISRFPILDSGIWDDPETPTREFVWARIDVPGDKDLWAVSLHLLTTNASRRNAQARSLVGAIRSRVPVEDYLVVGGDLNTNGRGEACIRTLAQVLETQAPYPADLSGNGTTNSNRDKPYDWVLVDRDLEAIETGVVVGSLTFPNGLVFDSRRYNPLDEVSPVQRGDSAALNMQHMAVVRDFVFPEDLRLPGEIGDAGSASDAEPSNEDGAVRDDASDAGSAQNAD